MLDESITARALAARGGDADAVEQFVRALQRDVPRYAAHLCADSQAVDDLAQDTFLRALGSLHRFEGRSSARTWLLSIARRVVVDSYRYAAARPRLSDVPDRQLAVELSQPCDLPGFDDGIALLDLLAARARASLMGLLEDGDTSHALLGQWVRSDPDVGGCLDADSGGDRLMVVRALSGVLVVAVQGGLDEFGEAVPRPP